MPELVTIAGPITDRVLGWSAETILVATALAAVAALAGRARGRLAIGPAARHALWLAVLVKLMAPPLVRWPWSIPVPAPSAKAEAPQAGPMPDVQVLPVAIDAPPDFGAIEGPPFPAPGPDAWAVAKGLGPWALAAWVAGSAGLVVVQGRRIVRFRRRLRKAGRAPAWLVEEAEVVGLRLGVRVPAIRAVPGLDSPMLWCLGRPVLLVPDDLLETLERPRWRSILTHELAHLRRLDPWVRRLELLAGLVWWWNPLYWLTRSRLDVEAELACDAWAVWAWPDDRLGYAESLLRIGAASALSPSPSPAAAPSPSLGVAGAARFFERRLTMILDDRLPRRAPASGFLGAAALTLLALPSWTLAQSPRDEPEEPRAVVVIRDEPAPNVIFESGATVEVDDEDDDAKAKAKAQADKAKAQADKAKAKADKAKAEAEGNKHDIRFEFHVDATGPGPDFDKKMKAMQKEIEAKFGPGSKFQKEMEALGKAGASPKDIEAKFGPGSDFAKEMEAFGKEMEAKFGPDSKFAEERKTLEKKAEKDRESAESRAKVAEKRAAEARARAEERSREVRVRVDRSATRARAESSARRARRIEMIESQIKKLSDELTRLKAEGAEDKDRDEDDNG